MHCRADKLSMRKGKLQVLVQLLFDWPMLIFLVHLQEFIWLPDGHLAASLHFSYTRMLLSAVKSFCQNFILFGWGIEASHWKQVGDSCVSSQCFSRKPCTSCHRIWSYRPLHMTNKYDVENNKLQTDQTSTLLLTASVKDAILLLWLNALNAGSSIGKLLL